jgi:hypothetical protein
MCGSDQTGTLVGRLGDDSFTSVWYSDSNKIKFAYYNGGLTMSSRNTVGFLLTSVVGIVLIAILTTAIPFSTYFNGEGGVETTSHPAGLYQNTDPELVVPESTVGEKPERYVHHWDDNPVATIPESTMGEQPQQYPHNWDDNPVAYIPESTLIRKSRHYPHNWDDNPVAYIPESTLIRKSRHYPHNWDDNPVAYIPESTMGQESSSAFDKH